LTAGRRAPKKGELFAQKLGHVVGGEEEKNKPQSYSSSSYFLGK
jgi:hypothetical protein